ncbi:hypothetical protein GGF46_004181 [Coemansia sp. RSA 552]|nr:hypothetical protein GGF46_004181 [Coemansia sp. RSA 552]
MKLSAFVLFLVLLVLSVGTLSAPIRMDDKSNSCDSSSCPQQMAVSSEGHGAAASLGRRQAEGPILPLPAPGESLLSYLDRLLSGVPLLGHLLEGLGYIRPKKN